MIDQLIQFLQERDWVAITATFVAVIVGSIVAANLVGDYAAYKVVNWE